MEQVSEAFPCGAGAGGRADYQDGHEGYDDDGGFEEHQHEVSRWSTRGGANINLDVRVRNTGGEVVVRRRIGDEEEEGAGGGGGRESGSVGKWPGQLPWRFAGGGFTDTKATTMTRGTRRGAAVRSSTRSGEGSCGGGHIYLDV